MKWITKEREVINIKDMSLNHLFNSIKMLQRNLRLEAPNGKLSQKKFDINFKRNLRIYFLKRKIINKLKHEYNKRIINPYFRI